MYQIDSLLFSSVTTPLGQTSIISCSHYSSNFLTILHVVFLQQVLYTIARVNFSEHKSNDKTPSCWTMILQIQRMMHSLHSLTQATSLGLICYPYSMPWPFRFWKHHASSSSHRLCICCSLILKSSSSSIYRVNFYSSHRSGLTYHFFREATLTPQSGSSFFVISSYRTALFSFLGLFSDKIIHSLVYLIVSPPPCPLLTYCKL